MDYKARNLQAFVARLVQNVSTYCNVPPQKIKGTFKQHNDTPSQSHKLEATHTTDPHSDLF